MDGYLLYWTHIRYVDGNLSCKYPRLTAASRIVTHTEYSGARQCTCIVLGITKEGGNRGWWHRWTSNTRNHFYLHCTLPTTKYTHYTNTYLLIMRGFWLLVYSQSTVASALGVLVSNIASALPSRYLSWSLSIPTTIYLLAYSICLPASRHTSDETFIILCLLACSWSICIYESQKTIVLGWVTAVQGLFNSS